MVLLYRRHFEHYVLDLTGYTTFTEERGDRAVAELATECSGSSTSSSTGWSPTRAVGRHTDRRDRGRGGRWMRDHHHHMMGRLHPLRSNDQGSTAQQLAVSLARGLPETTPRYATHGTVSPQPAKAAEPRLGIASRTPTVMPLSPRAAL